MADFAYHVPLDPDRPDLGFGTFVRGERVRVGDRLDFSPTKVIDGQIVVGSEPGIWEVIAIRPCADDGRRFGPRRIGAEDAVFDGELVLRPVDRDH